MPDEVRHEEGLSPSPEIERMEEARLTAIEAGAEGFAQNANNPQQQPQEKETANA